MCLASEVDLELKSFAIGRGPGLRPLPPRLLAGVGVILSQDSTLFHILSAMTAVATLPPNVGIRRKALRMYTSCEIEVIFVLKSQKSISCC